MNELNIQLTPTELELMSILWKIEKGSIKEIMAELPADRNLAYTSVSTIIRILEKKGFVNSEKKGRGHIYFPMIEQSSFEKSTVNSLVSNVFNGAPVSIVKCLIEDEKLSTEDIKELKKLLEGIK
jgi:predicted transcriptional regulator